MDAGLTTATRWTVAPAVRSLALVPLGILLLAALVQRYELALVLAVPFAGLAFVGLLLRPELATVIAVFLLYSNIPSVLLRLYGVPEVVAGSFILLLCLPLLRYLVFERQRARGDAVFLWMMALLCTMILSSLMAQDKRIAFERIEKYVLEGLLLYWLILNTVRSGEALRRVVWAALAAGAMLGSMSIYQSATGDFATQFGGLAERRVERKDEAAVEEEPAVTELKVTAAMRADGPQLGKNRYAQVMLVLLPLAWMQFRNARSRSHRLLAIAAGSLILVGGVALTYSRGAYLAVAAMIAAATWVTHWLRPSRLALAALCGLLMLPVVAPITTQRLVSLGGLTDLSDPSEADGSLRGRATEMLSAFNVMLDYPLLGVGPGQYTPFYSVKYHQRIRTKFRDIQVQRRAHTLYFEMGAEGGVVGLAVFLVIPLLLLRDLNRERRYWARRRPELATMAGAPFIAIIGFLASAVFLSHAYYRFYWFLIAIAGATLFLLREARAAEQASKARRSAAARSRRIAEVQHVR